MPLDALLDRRLLIISGKGGVGKTTVAAGLSVLAARLGKKVLVCEVEGKRALASMFEIDDLTETPTQIGPNLYGMNISAEKSLEEYFDVQFHMKRIARPLISSQLVDYVTSAAPGLRDILMLGKVWYEATRKQDFELIVLDTPAAGHAVSMLRSPQGFLEAVPLGPLAAHARQVSQWLQDPNQVSIHLVSMAEEMPVAETIETTHLLEDRMAMNVSNVFVNMVYPPLFEDPELVGAFESVEDGRQLVDLAKSSGGTLDSDAAGALISCARFYSDRFALQQEHLITLTQELAHTAEIVALPFLFARSFGSKEVDMLADAIGEGLSR